MLPHDATGSGPPIVLLHAGIADRTMWAEHLEPLARAGYRTVAVDLPGFGEAPVGSQTPWEAVLATLDGLGLERAALAGNSFGGAVALRVAWTAPQRVSALALVSAPPPVFEPSPELAAAWEAEEEALEHGDVGAAVEAVLETWLLRDASPQLRERVAAMQRRAFELQAGAGEGEGQAPDPLEERPERLREIDVPTLVAAGEHDLPDFRAGAEEMARALPNARHVVIARAGHLAPLETPDAFREILLGLLRSSANWE